MGLKKKNYEVEKIGITLPLAYAQVREISIYENECNATIFVHKDRESIEKFAPIETKTLCFKFDRSKNLLGQIYENAKEKFFHDWQDDIIQ
jgi:hypothetical protein